MSILFFAQILRPDFQDFSGGAKWFWHIFGLLLGIFALNCLWVEITQIFNDPKGYLTSVYNWNDLFQYSVTLFIVIVNIFGDGTRIIGLERSLCSFVLLSQGAKAVLDWLRLFDNTSFYVTLILKTIRDIGYIAWIIIIILIYIGSALYMLNLNANLAGDENAAIVTPIFDNFLVDSVLN